MDDRSLEQKLASLDARMKKVERYMLWGTIFSTLRTVIILVPIVLAFIFIPPAVKKYLPFVTSLMNFSEQVINRVPGTR